MGRQAVKLSWERISDDGRGRYRKSFKKRRWQSVIFPCRSRRNESEARMAYLVWKEAVEKAIAAEQKAQNEADPIRANLAVALEEEIALANLTGDRKQSKWARDVLEIVRHTDHAGVREVAELLGVPAEGTEPLEHAVARQTVRDIIKKACKNQQLLDPGFETQQLVEQWLDFRLAEVVSGHITVGTLDNNRRQLGKFAKFCPDIRSADEMSFLEFRSQLLREIADGASPYSQRDVLTTVKNFLEWCGDTAKVIDPITNLRKSGTGIKVPTKRIISTWDTAVIQKLFRTVTGKRRLFYLLILNTGAYESDIGTWGHNWTDGRGVSHPTFDRTSRTITFKRHKEKDEPDVPTVTYKLWDDTFRHLEQFVSSHPTLLLTTDRGTCLWEDEIKSDAEKKIKRKRKNVIGKQYGRFKKKYPEFGTLDDLRKTAISALDDHGEYARYAQYFAGHSPKGTTDRFYRKPSQTQFDKAVIWLGEHFGFGTTR